MEFKSRTSVDRPIQYPISWHSDIFKLLCACDHIEDRVRNVIGKIIIHISSSKKTWWKGTKVIDLRKILPLTPEYFLRTPMPTSPKISHSRINLIRYKLDIVVKGRFRLSDTFNRIMVEFQDVFEPGIWKRCLFCEGGCSKYTAPALILNWASYFTNQTAHFEFFFFKNRSWGRWTIPSDGQVVIVEAACAKSLFSRSISSG